MTRAGSDAAGVAAIVAGAACVVAAVGFRGDFPLSDDWSYAYSVRSLCSDGTLRFLPWTGASLILQSWYGAALCRLFGFSFDVLRLSTIALASAGTVAFFLMLGHAGVRGAPRGLATALFALDPLYVNLSFTFMTDVPCTVFAVFAGYAYVRGFVAERRTWLFAGGLSASAALLIRQHGIFVAGAAAFTALAASNRPWRARLADAIAAGAVPLTVAVVFHLWLFLLHGAPGAVAHKIDEATRLDVLSLVNAAFRGLETIGLVLVPLALAARRDVVARHPRLVAAVAAFLGLLAGALYLKEGAAMPYLTNVMYDLGLGASTLRDTLFLGLRPPIELGAPLALILTVAATAGAAFVAVACGDALVRRHTPVATFLALATLLVFLGTLLQWRYYFDRYLVIVVPFAIATLATTARIAVTRTSVALLALLAWYAVAGTHDYMAWNRARYGGLAELAAAGVGPRQIDGGMEFNAWHLAPSLDRWQSDDDVRPGKPPTTKSWWWVVDDQYLASFRPLPGYGVRSTHEYRRWLVPGTGRVVILERLAP